MRSLIDILDLSTDEIAELISTADDIIANHDKYMDICHGKKLATLFFEPDVYKRQGQALLLLQELLLCLNFC